MIENRKEEISDEFFKQNKQKPLLESIDDAGILLWYAAREGKNLSDDSINDIVLAQSALSADKIDVDIERRFWIALRKLGETVRPASVDSILATYSYPFGVNGREKKRRLVDASSTKKRYTVMSLVVLFLLLTVQIYWFVGTTWRDDLQGNRDELDRVAGSLREMKLEVQTLEEIVTLKKRHLDDVKGRNNIENISGEAKQFVESQINELIRRQSRMGLEFNNKVLRGERILATLQGNYLMLDMWDFVSDFVPTGGSKYSGNEVAAAIERAKSKTNIINELADFQHFASIVDINESYFTDEQLKVEVALLNSQSLLAVIGQYFLPLLYGILGSLAYILRTLSTEIQNVTFTRGSEIRYSLRWPLGMLGGITVGLFFAPENFSGLAVITPLGLAFLAGYGVELLFTALDKIVQAFIGANSPQRPGL